MTYSPIRSRFLGALLLLSTSILAGCGDPDSVIREAAFKIAELENSGQVPRFDQSTSVVGTDTNGNGVRDDIDAFIAEQAISEPQKKALLQAGRALQLMLTTPLDDKTALNRATDLGSRAMRCIYSVFKDGNASTWATKIEAITANTRQRTQRYLQYNKAISGSVIHLPNGDTCEP
ncbi:hypothetical protein [Ottowia caeni]|uniref:hypothetical protein n=1 Tax=Ottowia caeni TaxID=2870339 RepID=UPI003D75CF58